MIAVVAEFLNFTTMLSLFAKSDNWASMDENEQMFKIWLLVEAVVVIVTVASNVLYVIVRSCQKVATKADFDDDDEENPDYNKDFLSSETN